MDTPDTAPPQAEPEKAGIGAVLIPGLLVAIYAALMPVHLPVGGFNMSLSDPFVLLFGPIYLFRLGGAFKFSNCVRKVVLFLTILTALSLITGVSGDSGEFQAIIRELVKIYAAGLAFLMLVGLFKDLGFSYFWPCLMSGAVCAAIVVASVTGLLPSAYGSVRQTGTFPNPNMFANYLAFALFMAMGIVYSKGSPKMRVIGIVITGLCVLGLLVSGSRGGLLGVAIGFMVFLAGQVLILGRSSSVIWVTTLAGAAGLMMAMTMGGEEGSGSFVLVDRLMATTEEGADLNVSKRLHLWDLGMDMFFDSPLMGNGYGSFFYRVFRPTHNCYVSYLAETGVVGTIALCLMIVAPLLYKVRRSTPENAVFILAAQSFWVCNWIQGITNNVDQWRSGWFCLALIAAEEINRGLSKPSEEAPIAGPAF
ncbi:MAG: O-antigen ligase family protein [Verrucomicrobiota bacterium]